MNKYDDFAMPSLENIENMAKAYAKMEKQYLLDKEDNINENSEVVIDVYYDIFESLDVVSKLCDMYPKNRKFLILKEKITKLKCEFESLFLDYNLPVPSSKYTICESSVIYDLVKLWANAMEVCLVEFKDYSNIKKICCGFVDLINEIVKY